MFVYNALRFLLIALTIVMMTNPVFAGERLALLIGNKDYKGEISALTNPHNDIVALKYALEKIKFKVTLIKDANLVQLREAVSSYALSLREAGDDTVGFFYYSGHGAINDRTEVNYIIPVDVQISESSKLWQKSLELRQIIRDLSEISSNASHFVVFDACRNKLRLKEEGKKGLFQPKGFSIEEVPKGMLIAYSTAKGKLASDKGEGIGPYAKVLAEEIVKPGVEAVKMFREVALRVRETRQQVPWSNDNGLPRIFLAEKKNNSDKPGDTFKDCPECPEMVVVPPGEFMMGSPKSEKLRDKYEGPRHKVTIAKKFAVGKFAVTRAQFSTFVNDTDHDVGNKCWVYEKKWEIRSGRSYENPGFSQDDTHPVVCVNWSDAKAYVKWLNNKVQGVPYKLLSEAEWEYVARAKTDRPFWWGKLISTSQANYNGNYIYNGSKGKYRKKTVSVDSFEPNDFGLYNVHGNVWEWVEDCWHKSYRGAPNNGKAWTKGGECSKRVLRGGSWYDVPDNIRSADRNRSNYDNRSLNYGFRVSRTLAR